jgi:hypothetical protein
LIIVIIFGDECNFRSSSLHSFLQPPVTSPLLNLDILLSALMLRPQRHTQNGTTNSVCNISNSIVQSLLWIVGAVILIVKTFPFITESESHHSVHRIHHWTLSSASWIQPTPVYL